MIVVFWRIELISTSFDSFLIDLSKHNVFLDMILLEILIIFLYFLAFLVY